MDNFVNDIKKKRIEKLQKTLKRNNINSYLASSNEEVISIVKSIAQEGETVACGGSYSLEETGVSDLLKSGYYNLIDRFDEVKGKDVAEREAFFADTYFASANAITEAGEIYNVDGHGNRVAALMFGPKKVIMVVGHNKIVKDLDEAEHRLKVMASPINVKRLEIEECGCYHTGECVGCRSDRRICCYYTIVKFTREKDRFHIIFMSKDLGF